MEALGWLLYLTVLARACALICSAALLHVLLQRSATYLALHASICQRCY